MEALEARNQSFTSYDLNSDSENIKSVDLITEIVSKIPKIKGDAFNSNLTITDLSNAKKILKIPKNRGEFIETSSAEFEIQSLAVLKAFVQQELQIKLPPIDKLNFTHESSIFHCSPETNRKLHIFLSGTFFNKELFAPLNERSSDLAYQLLMKHGKVSRELLREYSDKGVTSVLQDQSGRNLVQSMIDEDFPVESAMLLLINALDANRQITLIIDCALANSDRSTRQTIRDELRELTSTMSLCEAAICCKSLNSLIYASLRKERPLFVDRTTMNGLFVRINLDERKPFDAKSYMSFDKSFTPDLDIKPFGYGPNMCPGWKLAMAQIRQLLAIVFYDDSDTFDQHKMLCPIL